MTKTYPDLSILSPGANRYDLEITRYPDLSILSPGAKIPNPRTIEGRQIRDLRDLRDFVDACIDATGNVALDVPMDMRLMRKVLSRTGKDIYDLEITRW